MTFSQHSRERFKFQCLLSLWRHGDFQAGGGPAACGGCGQCPGLGGEMLRWAALPPGPQLTDRPAKILCDELKQKEELSRARRTTRHRSRGGGVCPGARA